jgi:hypothetical protein
LVAEQRLCSGSVHGIFGLQIFKLFVPCILSTYEMKKPTDVTILILFIYRRISTCFGPTGPSSGEFTQLFTQPLVPGITINVTMYYNIGQFSYKIIKYNKLQICNLNGCVNSCVNSPEDGPVGPKHVEIRRYMNKIEIVTSVGFYHFIC